MNEINLENLTPFQKWQYEKFGNYLEETPDENFENETELEKMCAKADAQIAYEILNS